MKILQKKDKGFTLVELLTVISIIGLLSTIVISSIVTAKTKANNAKIIMNAKVIANAIYLARDPVTGDWPGTSGWQCLKTSGSCWASALTGRNGATDVMNKISTYLVSVPLITTSLFPSGTFGYDSYVYNPNASSASVLGGPAGAYLVWGQTKKPSGNWCAGQFNPDGEMESDNVTVNYYCYQFLGSVGN